MDRLGPQLRALRTAAGRTVASVATEAGLSVPYIANLENGRGNPTTAALSRLAGALGTQLVISLVPADGSSPGTPAQPPASLVRFCRGQRFRRAARAMASALGTDPRDLSRDLVGALAQLASILGTDLGETDWGRILDALLLVTTYPAAG
ncbi:MAG TPA: helix-turn-helix transcriptional regulator [Streptosporangiaceae bacterium]|jgi:transcriptional regulator with XRE-family HTH domain